MYEKPSWIHVELMIVILLDILKNQGKLVGVLLTMMMHTVVCSKHIFVAF